MEKILNDEEKIRRAEAIYYKRNNQNFPSVNRSREKNSKISIKDKFLLHLIIMFDIAIIVFAVQNKDFIFTKEFLSTLDTYNNQATEQIINFFNNLINEDSLKNSQVENIISDDLIEKSNKNIQNSSNSVQDSIIEDASSVTVQESNSSIVQEISSSSMNEMELDILNLKAAYTFINPLNGGVVSSTFGSRESKYQNVTGYHTGIDIAADAGTPIVASMQGIVEMVSGEGDYGKHIKIRSNNVTTLYAHCSKIFVKEGQIVAEGDKIANVGSTGNSTGPHLHFEIRVEDRFVDPARIINF